MVCNGTRGPRSKPNSTSLRYGCPLFTVLGVPTGVAVGPAGGATATELIVNTPATGVEESCPT